ncbi:carboxymuconolactone decarboxylase family protein [Streptomyces chiangmaiensis]|uniref:Carboxymuconolactone decarboxylase family protein n=1 Tax=Streptomyces chiangmaiensis TaxID=766497 RepID=A0ABU7FY75_9ACTN|nr:carboxymuconolactone decarboxylase family protein [Streptomyces chiangmaiensis]MED7828892.1 carboxymuconolactone decarboxylase family protein [Streptomyces chiangmaiensis]
MDARLNVFVGSPTMATVVKHLAEVGKAIEATGLPLSTQKLVQIRASQINGCSFCVDMHTKDALAAGAAPQRINLVAAWREATVFTDAERAALEFVEQGTRFADTSRGVTDEAWAAAAEHYDNEQLIGLVTLIALINTYNRLNAIARRPAGDYQPVHTG